MKPSVGIIAEQECAPDMGFHFGMGKTINKSLRQQAMFLSEQNQFPARSQRNFIHDFEDIIVADLALRRGGQQFFHGGRTPHGGLDWKISQFAIRHPGFNRTA